MNNFRLTADLALPAAIHRIKMLEEKLQAVEATVASLQVRANQMTASISDQGEGLGEMGKFKIVVPNELKSTRGKFNARGNRSYHIVSQRWKMWRDAWQAGMTPSEIGLAWGCDHSTVRHAIRRNFIAKRIDPRKYHRTPVRTDSKTGKFIK